MSLIRNNENIVVKLVTREDTPLVNDDVTNLTTKYILIIYDKGYE